MQIHYDIDRIKHILHHMTCLTGISLSFMNTEQEYLCFCCPPNNYCAALTEKDERTDRYCWECDQRILEACRLSGRPEGHICHAGLFDAIVPIIKSEIVVGYVVPGRIRVPSSPRPRLYGDDPHLTELWNALPCYDDRQLHSLMELLPHILLDNAIELRRGDLASEVVAYMRENLSRPLDVQALCTHFFVSRNTLYRAFGKELGTSVTQCLTRLRMERAQRLLTDTTMSIGEIAQAVGIEDYHYFCRVFRRHTGIPPGAFRRRSHE